MKYNRFLPVLIPFLVWLSEEAFFFYPKQVYVVLVIVNLLIFFSVRQFARGSFFDHRWWNYLILPALFTTSLVSYSILLERFWAQFLFIINVLFLYFYLKIIYYYLIQPGFYKENALENISLYGNFLIFLFTSSSVYGLQSFLNVKLWPLMIIIIAVSSLIIYEILWANKINLKQGAFYIFLSSLILVELAWAISFLPLNFNIAALVLTICYYVLSGLVRFYLLGRLEKRPVRLYVSFGLLAIFLVLLTARWM